MGESQFADIISACEHDLCRTHPKEVAHWLNRHCCTTKDAEDLITQVGRLTQVTFANSINRPSLHDPEVVDYHGGTGWLKNIPQVHIYTENGLEPAMLSVVFDN